MQQLKHDDKPTPAAQHTFVLLEAARPYWLIAQKFHSGARDRLRKAQAVHSMVQLRKELNDGPVARRVKGFISKHRPELPSNSPNGDGPRRA